MSASALDAVADAKAREEAVRLGLASERDAGAYVRRCVFHDEWGRAWWRGMRVPSCDRKLAP